MIFEVRKIHNGWEIKGTWIEPGGGGLEAQPRTETLYCREISVLAGVMVVWTKKGFEFAYQTLQEILQKEEAH